MVEATRRLVLLVVALTAAGCLRSSLDECAGGRICPLRQVCAPAGDRCVFQEQIDACGDLNEHAACSYFGRAGSCSAGFCLASGEDGPFTVTISLPGGGAGAVTSDPSGIDCGARCSASFDLGTRVSLTARPAPGSTFAGWGAPCSGTAGCVFTVTASTTVSATFMPPPPPTIVDVTPAGGGIGQPVVIRGTSFTGASAVTFNGTEQRGFVVVAPDRIETTVPAGASSGAITVTTPGGSTSSATFVVIVVDVTAVAAPAARAGGCVDVSYVVAQAESRPADVVVEIDPGTGVFQRAAAAEPSATAPVSTSPGGATHRFRWKSTADLPHRVADAARVRVSATVAGVAGSAGASLTRGPVTVDNSLSIAPAAQLVTGTGSTAVAAGDLDGDGDADLAVANGVSNDVSILLGDGGGGFVLARNIAVAGGPSAIVAGDLDGDGRLDLAVATLEGHAAILRGSGGGAFKPPVMVEGAAGPCEALAAGDLDRDGKLDLVLAGRDGLVWTLRGRGDGTFNVRTSVPVGPFLLGIALADLDGDGDLDVVVSDLANHQLRLVTGNGDGTLGPVGSVPAGAAPRGVVAGFIDGDGTIDLAVTSDDGQLLILLGDGDGTFRAAAPIAVGLFPIGVGLGDLDRDGAVDLAVTDFNAHVLWTLRGRGDGTFEAPAEHAAARRPRAVALADLDGDGALDVVAAGEDRQNVSIFLNQTAPPCAPAYVTRPHVPAGKYPNALAAGDLDGDGRADLAVVNLGDDDVSILLGNGDGSFRAAGRQRSSNPAPTAIAFGDLDGDGHLDLVTADFADGYPGQPPGHVSVMLGEGGGDFAPAVAYEAGTGPNWVAITDLDEDGRDDVLISDYGGGDATILRGNGDGTLQPPDALPVAPRPLTLAAGDLDGDGRPDLVVLSQDGDAVVLLATATGFAAPATFHTTIEPVATVLADVDADGRLDLVTVHGNRVGTVSVRLGDGKGGFGAQMDYQAGSTPTLVAVVDLDADGKLDLAVTAFADDSVWILHGNGDGTFQVPVEYPAGAAPSAVAVADLDGDGLLDLAVSNISGDDVSILLAR